MSETRLYGGKVKLEFDQRKHSYIVTDYDDGGKPVKVPSVTQILGIIDKSGPLTQWAANCAINWLHDKIEAGKLYSADELESAFRDARFNFRKVAKKAQDIGTLAHEWIESYIKACVQHEAVPTLPFDDEAQKSCIAATNWMDAHEVSFIDTETKIYSRAFKYAGTLDCVAEVDGRIALIDWKTSAAVYPEYRLQLAAYAQAYSEMRQGVEDRWIVRIDKNDGTVEPLKLLLESQWFDFKAFMGAKRVYTRMSELNAAAKSAKAAKDVAV